MTDKTRVRSSPAPRAALAPRWRSGSREMVFAVVINYSGDVKSADALAAKIESGGGRALAAQGRCW